MKKNNILTSIVEGRGFYIVMLLCLVTVGATGYIIAQENTSLDNAKNGLEIEIGEQVLDPQIAPPPPSFFEADVGSASVVVPKEVEKKVEEAPKQEQSVFLGSTKKSYIMPVEGVISKPYSTDQLIYDKTLEDYRTHAGVDFKGDVGTNVRAVEAGTVFDVYVDEMMGNTVTIDHGGDTFSVYSNLQDKILVKKGQKVKKGDTIGGIGQSAAAESGDVFHLHFEMVQKGKQIDPMSLIKK